MLNEEDLFNIITNNLAEELIASHFEDYFNLIMDFNNKAYDNGSEYVSSILNIRKKESSVLKAIKSLINFNVTELFGYSDRVYSKLKNQTFKGSTNTMERVNTNINNALSEGYRNGLGNKEIGKNLQKQFTGLKTHEATRIATTEVNSAQSLGAYEQYFIDDQEYHQWLAAGDDRTRLTHSDLNGEIVKVGTPFSNGLLHPGDRNENIKEWINCRCTTVPWICPYNMMVPPGMVRFRESDLIPINNDLEDTATIEYDEGYTHYKYDDGTVITLNREYAHSVVYNNKEYPFLKRKCYDYFKYQDDLIKQNKIMKNKHLLYDDELDLADDLADDWASSKGWELNKFLRGLSENEHKDMFDPHNFLFTNREKLLELCSNSTIKSNILSVRVQDKPYHKLTEKIVKFEGLTSSSVGTRFTKLEGTFADVPKGWRYFILNQKGTKGRFQGNSLNRKRSIKDWEREITYPLDQMFEILKVDKTYRIILMRPTY